MMRKSKLLALTVSAMLAMTSVSVMPAWAAPDDAPEVTEQEALAYVCAELGIDDWDAYLADLAAQYQADDSVGGTRDTCPFDPDYYIDIYTGGSSNGQIDIYDAMYLQQFLTGQVNYPYVYTDLDPTQDCIIDKADVQALLSCYSFVIVLEDYPDFVPGTHGSTNTVYSSENRAYYKYNAQTAAYISDYTLYSPPTSAVSMSATIENHSQESFDPTIIEKSQFVSSHIIPDRGVIGDDDMELDNSRIGAVKIMTELNGTNSWGSGCIIDAHTILTAAHIVYSYSNSSAKKISQIRLFDSNGNRIIKTPNIPNDGDDFTPVEIHVPWGYVYGLNYTDYRNGFDYAIITVNEDLSSFSNFKLGFPLNQLNSANTTLGVTGYPQFVRNVKVNNNVLSGTGMKNARYHGAGHPSSNGSNLDVLISHLCDTNGGDSGAPLHYTYGNGSETEIGVHVAGSSSINYATRINVDILHFCLHNNNIIY